jgi:hypothetical protein
MAKGREGTFSLLYHPMEVPLSQNRKESPERRASCFLTKMLMKNQLKALLTGQVLLGPIYFGMKQAGCKDFADETEVSAARKSF